MDEIAALQALGLELPSPAYLIGAVVFSLVGWVAWRRGRRTGPRRIAWWGVALMLFPYAVSRTWLLYVVGLALCVAVAMEW